MQIVGIDLSMTSTGVATLHRSETRGEYVAAVRRVMSAPSKRSRGDKTPRPITERNARVGTIIAEVLVDVRELRADLVVVEGPAYSRGDSGTWDRAWLWGRLVDELLALELPLAVCPPSVRAKWATGSGAAGKSSVGVHMSRLWPNVDPGITDDEWDALALATMGAQHLGALPIALERHREPLTRVEWPATAVEVAA